MLIPLLHYRKEVMHLYEHQYNFYGSIESFVIDLFKKKIIEITGNLKQTHEQLVFEIFNRTININ